MRAKRCNLLRGRITLEPIRREEILKLLCSSRDLERCNVESEGEENIIILTVEKFLGVGSGF